VGRRADNLTRAGGVLVSNPVPIMNGAGKKLAIRHVPGPQGVRGRNSDNRLIAERLGWKPTHPLREGLEKTYRWIEEQVRVSRSALLATVV